MSEAKEVNIVLAGVGGQGTIAMCEVIGRAAVIDGYRVRGSEVLGMAQRGGAVTAHLRLGSDVHGSMVPEGKADIVVSMEPSEALRNLRYFSKDTMVIVSTRPMIPPSVSLGLGTYPSMDAVIDTLSKMSRRVITIDIYGLAIKAGSAIAANMVMLGALAGTGKLPLRVESLKKAIAERFKGKAAEVNLKAFDLGYEHVRKVAASQLA
ncbi:MAG: indolepyruvate ferredoxin oxidoreductase subunit beta [Candidatus Nezhaarchaeota archaeon]|nr:indolepyruvate ferredoxin oxidoreductase subunit beta [Candidatus Nezhaarchaeota archaeon]